MEFQNVISSYRGTEIGLYLVEGTLYQWRKKDGGVASPLIPFYLQALNWVNERGCVWSVSRSFEGVNP